MEPGFLLRAATLVLAAASLAPAAAQQAAYPVRPVQIVVPFAPGGSVDLTMRIVGAALTERLGQQVLVLNRPGAGTTIGMNQVAKAPPDGYLLGAASFSFAANPQLMGDRMPYDTEKDFAPVTQIARSAVIMLVNAQSPARTLRDFIEHARARPGQLNYGSVGIASSGHLISALFETMAGIRMVHVPVPTGPLPSLVANDLQLQFSPIPTALQFVRAGKLFAIGVSSLEPDPSAPGVPPIAETLPGFSAYEWPSLVAPAGTPPAIINRLQQEVARVLAEPEVKKRIEATGSQPVGSLPAEFADFIRREMAIWGKVAAQVRAAGGN